MHGHRGNLEHAMYNIAIYALAAIGLIIILGAAFWIGLFILCCIRAAWKIAKDWYHDNTRSFKRKMWDAFKPLGMK